MNQHEQNDTSRFGTPEYDPKKLDARLLNMLRAEKVPVGKRALKVVNDARKANSSKPIAPLTMRAMKRRLKKAARAKRGVAS